MVQDLSIQYTEKELINECVMGNELAQRYLYELFYAKMYAVCVRYIGDKDLAQDILHDGFINLFLKLKDYRGDGSFEGWARRLFINTSLMHLRKNDALKQSEEINEVASKDFSIEPNIVERMDASVLMEMISSMPAGFRTVFNMFAIEGFTHSEIAKQLQISEGGSRSQLSRARLWLQERIKEFENL